MIVFVVVASLSVTMCCLDVVRLLRVVMCVGFQLSVVHQDMRC
jgi:hypothetical protein